MRFTTAKAFHDWSGSFHDGSNHAREDEKRAVRDLNTEWEIGEIGEDNDLTGENKRIIYVKLLNEGTDVWRPVVAKALRDNVFQIALAEQEGLEEQWEFRPGSVVRCEWVELSGEPTLAAVQSDDYYPVHLAAEAQNDPIMARVAESFRENGIDVTGSVLADFFPDDTSLFFGLLVTPKGTVFRFDFDYLRMEANKGRVKHWEDITSFWQTTPYEQQIAAALRFVGAAK